MTGPEQDFEARLQAAVQLGDKLRNELSKALIGQALVIEQLLWGVLTHSHTLLEGVPGVGKTLLVKSLASTLNLTFARIQCTPDLMPSDITGGTILKSLQTGDPEFLFQRGPIFTQLLLVDEINRASPKTQSALLEAMQEHTVTALGTSHALPEPFLVVATENPIEHDGTYPLPEAQLDRFLLKVIVPSPNAADLEQILAATTGQPPATLQQVVSPTELLAAMQCCREVIVSAPVLQYVSRLLVAASPESDTAPALVKRHVRFGPSVRGGQALLLAAKARALLRGDLQVGFDDIKSVALPALRHRLHLTFTAEAESVLPEHIVTALIDAVASRPEHVRRGL